MLIVPPRENRWPVITAIDWWYDRIRAWMKRFKYVSFSQDTIKRVPQDPGISEFKAPDLTSQGSCDASPLFRRMARLHIDKEQLAKEDPLLFRELQRLCAVCQSKGRCTRDLAHELQDPGWQDWRDYCPNSTTLNALSALSALRSSR